MARKKVEIEMIKENSFMGLLATKGQIPSVIGTPIAPELSRTGRLFEVVGREEKKAQTSFRIVRPASWGMIVGNGMNGGVPAH